MESKFYAPPREFEGCFTTFYRLNLSIDAGEKICDYMPPEWASIRFFSGDVPDAQMGEQSLIDARVAASGPRSLAAKFALGDTRMWGIGIMPLGWARLFDSDADAVADKAMDAEKHPTFCKFAPLADVLCDDSVRETEQYDALVDFMREAMQPHPEEERILRIHRALVEEDLSKVTDFAERVQLSVRTLERLCCRFFGFTPKLLLRRQRFMRSLSAFMLQSEGKWTKAMDAHYHDQAQFSREFAAFMGMTPTEYAALDHPFLRSFTAARAAVVGSPAQTLDAPDR
ncbi:helix-turn-helix domain-containing protein [Aurantiacibacter sp. D1-12]|uniref:helix-turn-helix domain-containing protein n=1 Tax=Aurantiacibacter sp. D1-12 TaxID=2993658 RepID=UPI00237CE47D|nr:AraC family transcriptional regulator [Aurantiacibacter sp. D1-12]MDE1468593.1 AraC family transcriptional regulator [Aurantiacibacter sp. D1-12]